MSYIDSMIPSVTLPEGEHGTVKIEHFTITDQDARMARFHYGGRAPYPGTYTRLKINGALMMSDTVAEKVDHLAPVRASCGDCLVMGLGIGMVAQAMIRRDFVNSVTVIEKNPDVIALVAPHMPEGITVIEADALEWTPPKGKKYSVIWHDIWQDISLDDVPERTKLKRRFARRWEDFHGCWAEDEIERLKREDRQRVWW